ncbi:MAG: DEAD/DEAH box helicase, partial [Proteobacteria bacterium]|nr:DEAD/DEAH box helicase [Pseudomonadota bacterium]
MVLKFIQNFVANSTQPSQTATLASAPGFIALGLIEPLTRAVASEGYSEPTPIQKKAIPDILAGRDMLGCAQTGTGKTAAFALPMLQRLSQSKVPGHSLRALILAPTRELALQIKDSFVSYGKHLPLRSSVAFGGVGIEPQIKAIRAGVDVLVATPGRLLDL